MPPRSSRAAGTKTITVPVITGHTFEVVLPAAGTIGDLDAAIERHGGPAPDVQKLVLDATQAPLPEDRRGADAGRRRCGRRLRGASRGAGRR